MAIRLPPKKPVSPAGLSDRGRDPARLLTIKQAAAFVIVSEVTIRRWIRAKLLRGYRVGAQIRIDKDDLIDFISQY